MKKEFVLRTDENGDCDSNCDLHHYNKYEMTCRLFLSTFNADETIRPFNECPLFEKGNIEMKVMFELKEIS